LNHFQLNKFASPELRDELSCSTGSSMRNKVAMKVAENLERQEGERLATKEAAERQYVDRLRANMKKYGVEDIEKILSGVPLPADKELSKQERKEKDRWYRNHVNGLLLDQGLPDGEIDEIVNDTGDKMVVDGVRITYTRMARRWLSVGTLKRYRIPFMIDEVSTHLIHVNNITDLTTQNDDSSLIIKRWVPGYEQDFL
jgi:hypothetical protein